MSIHFLQQTKNFALIFVPPAVLILSLIKVSQGLTHNSLIWCNCSERCKDFFFFDELKGIQRPTNTSVQDSNFQELEEAGPGQASEAFSYHQGRQGPLICRTTTAGRLGQRTRCGKPQTEICKRPPTKGCSS